MQYLVSTMASGTGRAIIKVPVETTASNELSSYLTQVAENRDKAAFTRLFHYFAPKIKRFGIKQLGSEAQAMELVQETMTNLWLKAHLFDSEKGQATTWVFTVMRNASFDMLRRRLKKAEVNLGDDLWPLEQAQAGEDHEFSVFADHLQEKQVRRFINRLPEPQQAVIKGVYYQDLTQAQLAEQLNVPIGTIKSRLRLALAKLKEQMDNPQDD